MKKLLSITGSLILTSSAVTILATNVNNYQTVTKIDSDSNINWKSVENYNIDYFKNIKENYHKNSNLMLISYRDSRKVNMDEVIDYAQNKANNYMKNFQSHKLNLNNLINLLSKENPEFAKNYNKTLSSSINAKSNELHNFQFLNSQNLQNGSDINQVYSNLQNLVQHVKMARTALVTLSAAAAVAAAAFWAAAWWFGISIPWATSCTWMVTISTIPISILSFILLKYDNEQTKWGKFGMALGSIYNLGHFMGKAALASLVTAESGLTATSWAFPAALAVIAIIGATLSWMHLF